MKTLALLPSAEDFAKKATEKIPSAAYLSVDELAELVREAIKARDEEWRAAFTVLLTVRR